MLELALGPMRESGTESQHRRPNSVALGEAGHECDPARASESPVPGDRSTEPNQSLALRAVNSRP